MTVREASDDDLASGFSSETQTSTPEPVSDEVLTSLFSS
ncbi:unnamed protein product, partial [marine sediment metagenome]